MSEEEKIRRRKRVLEDDLTTDHNNRKPREHTRTQTSSPASNFVAANKTTVSNKTL